MQLITAKKPAKTCAIHSEFLFNCLFSCFACQCGCTELNGMLPGKAVLYMRRFCLKNQRYDGKRNWCIQEPIQRLIILIPVGTNLSKEKKMSVPFCVKFVQRFTKLKNSRSLKPRKMLFMPNTTWVSHFYLIRTY